MLEKRRAQCENAGRRETCADMNIVATFIKRLSWRKRYFLPTLHLHYNGALQHVNEPMCIVSVDGVRSGGRILHCDYQNFLAREIPSDLSS